MIYAGTNLRLGVDSLNAGVGGEHVIPSERLDRLEIAVLDLTMRIHRLENTIPKRFFKWLGSLLAKLR